jgi:peptide/nickel transport system ATP-binding protein/oligopeptide transport system ATP-binding protein
VSLLEVNDVAKRFPARRNMFGRVTEWVEAVRGVSFTVGESETVALVGESGAGKSTTGRLALRLIEPDAGSVRFDGVDVLALDRRALRASRQRMQMIFQDPYGSLDPRVTIGDSVAEPLLVHRDLGREERLGRAAALLERVGLRSDALDRYPRELSGGQLQRVAIARALTLEPKLIVCDEPVAALDTSVRAQVLTLMQDLQRDLGIAYLFVTHDLALVEVIAHRIVVMRHGEVVESGATADIFDHPSDPYTQELLAAIPVPVPKARRVGAGPPAVTLAKPHVDAQPEPLQREGENVVL